MAQVLRKPRRHPLYTMQRGTWQTAGRRSTCGAQGSGAPDPDGRALLPSGCICRLLMRRILRLRRIELDLDGFRFVVDVEDLAEGLVPLGDHLRPNGALWGGPNHRNP